jgi:hypothetical protein
MICCDCFCANRHLYYFLSCDYSRMHMDYICILRTKEI